jgi:hypothetical protein
MSQLYIIIAIVSLAVIAFLVLNSINGKKQKRLSRLAAIAFSLIVAGLIFGENRWLSYPLIGTGIILALIDIRNKH